MKRIASILLVLLLCATQTSFAASEKSYQLAEELLILNNVKTQLDSMYGQMEQMLLGQVDSAKITAEEKEHVKNIQKVISDILFESMSWETMKGEYIELYANTFTEEELAGIIAFSKSPVGQKLNEKTPILMQKSMMIGQQKAQMVMPKVQQAIMDYMEQNNMQ